MYMHQNANANYESIKKQDLLDGALQSRSGTRRRCYKLKHDMIVSPARNFMTCVCAGFLFNLPIMGAIIIVYEKVRNNFLRISSNDVTLNEIIFASPSQYT